MFHADSDAGSEEYEEDGLRFPDELEVDNAMEEILTSGSGEQAEKEIDEALANIFDFDGGKGGGPKGGGPKGGSQPYDGKGGKDWSGGGKDSGKDWSSGGKDSGKDWSGGGKDSGKDWSSGSKDSGKDWSSGGKGGMED